MPPHRALRFAVFKVSPCRRGAERARARRHDISAFKCAIKTIGRKKARRREIRIAFLSASPPFRRRHVFAALFVRCISGDPRARDRWTRSLYSLFLFGAFAYKQYAVRDGVERACARARAVRPSESRERWDRRTDKLSSTFPTESRKSEVNAQGLILVR